LYYRNRVQLKEGTYVIHRSNSDGACCHRTNRLRSVPESPLSEMWQLGKPSPAKDESRVGHRRWRYHENGSVFRQHGNADMRWL